MKYHKIIIYLLLIISFAFGQNMDRFSRQQETALDFSSLQRKKEMLKQSEEMQLVQPENFVMTPIEKAIDPEAYIVGPGDQFGININSLENLNFVAYVGPAGDVLIPTAGVVDVNGKKLNEAIEVIKEIIIKEYKSADVYVSLINVRYFKVQISGAVNRPGFYMVTPLSRLDDIITLAMGVHFLAKDYALEIRHGEKETTIIDFVDYLSTGNLENNPNFQEGDAIFVPFGDLQKEGVAIRGSIDNGGYDIIKTDETLGNFINRRAGFMENVDLQSITITRDDKIQAIEPEKLFTTKLMAGDIIDINTEKGVSVNGFVQVPGSYKYFAGYTCADYIGLAGGNSKEGNAKKAFIKHKDGSIEKGMDVIIQRGDQIVVPRSMSQWWVGNSSIGQLVISMTSVYMSYRAATK